MKVKINKKVEISPEKWYYRFKDEDIVFTVEASSPGVFRLSDDSWKQFVSPYEIKVLCLDGLFLDVKDCVTVPMLIRIEDANKLVFKDSPVNSKSYIMFIEPGFLNPEKAMLLLATMTMDEARNSLRKQAYRIFEEVK